MPAASPGFDARLVDGDLPIVGGLVTSVDLTLQRLSRRIQTHLGECAVDRFAGIDWLAWFQTIPVDVDLMIGLIRAQIDTCPGIARTANLTGAFDSSTFTATFRGTVAIDQTNQTAALTLQLSNNGNPAVTLLLLQPASFFA